MYKRFWSAVIKCDTKVQNRNNTDSNQTHMKCLCIKCHRSCLLIPPSLFPLPVCKNLTRFIYLPQNAHWLECLMHISNETKAFKSWLSAITSVHFCWLEGFYQEITEHELKEPNFLVHSKKNGRCIYYKFCLTI